ncbi:multi-sensor hybrid histidine kinase [Catenovulum agarivorans DS-2]|uniref:histidine kinase n=1 Tax=Catenovulum agarivorans DS-2 TaxID=1328313 RepID=W7QB94_9ALTE|nr:ATP-binding protein [Catenovulum agarivorans]EWH09251.1 multi-sensor hybrid histidine kinase [Catenovulum agarivorans DS-2]
MNLRSVISFFVSEAFAPPLEALFKQQLEQRARSIIAYIYVIGGIVPLLFLLYALSVSSDFFYKVAEPRLIYLAIWLMICLATFTRFAILNLRQSYLIYTFSGVTFVTYINSILMDNQLFSVPSILMFLIGLVIAQIGAKVQLYAGLIAISVPLILISLFDVWSPADIGVMVLLVIWAIISWLAALILEKNNRKLFRYEQALEQSSQEKAALLDKEARANQFKRQFLAHMSHEIRTPLTSILGYSHSYFDQGFSQQQKDNAVKTIHSNSLHLLKIVNDVLDLSKIEAGKLEFEMLEIDIVELLQSIEHSQSRVASEKGVQLTINYQWPLPQYLITDPTRLRQILLNLTSNAIKFTNDKGIVSVRVSFDSKANKLQFSVTDTGIGMDKKSLKQLFTAFNQADSSHSRKFGGTGLGLYISSQLIDKLGGRIAVKSVPGEGSCFSFDIQVTVPEPVNWLNYAPTHTTAKERMNQQVAQYQAKVLLADDHEDNRKLIRYWLEKSGVQVDEAENGEQAVEKALLFDFDLIFLDIQMPHMDGVEALTMIRANGYDIPIIALTANALKQEVDGYLTTGFNDHLAKPVDVEVFQKLLSKYLSDLADEDEPLFDLASEEFQKLVADYKSSLDCELEMVKHARQADNWSLLTKVAHRIKGSAGNFGFSQLTDAAAELEQCLRNNGLNERESLYQNFLNQLQLAIRG